MPASDSPGWSTRAWRPRAWRPRAWRPGGWRPRAIATALAVAVSFAAGGGPASADEATNWSRQIGAIRGSQIAYEGVMRAADLQLRSLKGAAKHADRALVKAKRNLKQARARRSEIKASHRTSLAQLGLARAREAAESAVPVIATGSAGPALLPFLAMASEEDGSGADVTDGVAGQPAELTGWPGAAADPDGEQVSESGAGSALVESLPLVAVPSQLVPSEPESAQPDGDGPLTEFGSVEIAALEKQVEQQKRVLIKASQRVRRIGRGHRAKVRAVAAIRHATRSAVARREGAESGLGNAILAMSRLGQRRVAKKTSVRLGRGSSFAWPSYGRISQTYGCTNFPLNPSRGSCGHFHDGIDIAGQMGAPVRSVAVGVVSYIGWNPWDQHGRAFMIVVAHPGGYETLYGHLLPIRRVRVGQLVRRGEAVGYMGSTGRSTGAHLHLEFRRGRTTLNPLAFL